MTKALALIAALVASPAIAQENCAPTPAAYEALSGQFGESRVWMGATDSSGIIAEVWANPATGSWTWVVTGQGQTCLVAQGVGYSMGDPA